MSWDPITQKHKGFAFVEYEVPEAAQLALEQMNGVIISGRNIKVGRPSNMPQAQQVIDDITLEAKNYNRIYVASIHQDLTQDDISSVFEAFGGITSCELAMTSVPNRHKGYCFIEYGTSQAATDAISSMNLFDLGGQYLRVGRSITPPDTKNQGPPSAIPQVMPTAAAVAAAAATAKIQAMDAVATNLGLKSADIMTSKSEQVSAAGGLSSMQQQPLTMTTTTSIAPPPASLMQPPPQPPLPASSVVESNSSAGAGAGGGYAAVPPPGIMTFAPTSLGQSVAPHHHHQQPPPLPSGPPLPAMPPVGEMPGHHQPKPPSGLPPMSVPSSGMAGAAALAASMASTASSHIKHTNPVDMLAQAEAAAKKKQQEELQKKLMEGQEPSTLQQQENMSIKGQSARHLVMQKLMRTQSESVVIVLRNMVTPDEVDDDLQDEISDECSKYGDVERVIIYQERQSEEDDAEVLVKIFVEFKTAQAAKKAKSELDGRFFGGRIVSCRIYDQDLYDHNDFSG